MSESEHKRLFRLAERLANLLAATGPARMQFVSEEQFLAVVGLRRQPVRVNRRRSRQPDEAS